MARVDQLHGLHLRWVSTTLVALPLLGCPSDGHDGPLRIVAANFDGDSTISLTFSQPIANADEIDANDFRISLALTHRYSSDYDGTLPYEFTTYSDPNLDGDTGLRTVTFASASPGPTPDMLVLVTTDAVGLDECEYLDYLDKVGEMLMQEDPDSAFESGLFMHYAAGDIPLESRSGEVLADIGRDWVLHDMAWMERDGFGFVNLNPQIEIPCP